MAEGAQHADRDAQFRYIASGAGEFLAAGDPVISVDAKKKEKAGEFANGGAEWRPKGQPERVNVHDFPSDATARRSPTASTTWALMPGGSRSARTTTPPRSPRRPCAAGGGPMGLPLPGRTAAADLRRCLRLQRRPGPPLEGGTRQAGRPDRAGEITVCHYPPGTSKWNKVEHRLFAQITRNWRGLPLTSHQAVVELISATTTTTGLTVTAELDTGEYPTGLRYTSKQVGALPIGKHDFHPDWNYTIRPEPH